MKKFGIIAFLLLVSSIIFAESYEELMDLAKKAESENKLITALGFYYDAAHTENAEPYAEIRFGEIKAVLESGKPDLSQEEDIFVVKDKWVELRKDFITYFTQNCPWTFYLGKEFERTKLDTDSKTADYKVYYMSTVSQKYRLLRLIISRGCPKEAEDELSLIGPKLSIRNLTSAQTWSKDWYNDLDKKINMLYDECSYTYYLGQRYKYGSKEQNYFFNKVNNSNFQKQNPDFEDLIAILNDYEAYKWKNFEFSHLASFMTYATIGFFEGDVLLYEIPNIVIRGDSLEPRIGNSLSDWESWDNGCSCYTYKKGRNGSFSEIDLKMIPQDIANKIEKGNVYYSIVDAYIPYGFYEVKDDSKIIPMKIEKIGTINNDFSVNNLDITYKKGDRVPDDILEKLYVEEEDKDNICVDQTNVFEEISSVTLYYRNNSRNDKKTDQEEANEIVMKYKEFGWSVKNDLGEEFWNEEELSDKTGKFTPKPIDSLFNLLLSGKTGETCKYLVFTKKI